MFQIHVKHCRLEYISIGMVIIIKKINSDQIYLVNLDSEHENRLLVPLSTQVYKWVPANLLLGVTLRWTSFPSRGE